MKDRTLFPACLAEDGFPASLGHENNRVLLDLSGVSVLDAFLREPPSPIAVLQVADEFFGTAPLFGSRHDLIAELLPPGCSTALAVSSVDRKVEEGAHRLQISNVWRLMNPRYPSDGP